MNIHRGTHRLHGLNSAGRSRLALRILLWALLAVTLAATVMPPSEGATGASAYEPPRIHEGAMLFGSDRQGRDFLPVLVAGAARSFRLATLGTCAVLGASIFFGIVQGWVRRGWAVVLLASATLGAVAMPEVALLMTVRAAWPRQVEGFSSEALAVMVNFSMVGVLALLAVPPAALLIADRFRSVMSSRFVAASRAVGCSSGRLLAREIAPHLAEEIAWIAAHVFPRFIIAEASLAYLGLGFQGRDGLGQLLATSFANSYHTTALLQFGLTVATLAWVSFLPQLALRLAGVLYPGAEA